MLETIYDFLVSQSTLTDILGSEIYPATLPQTASYPALVFSMVTANHEHTLQGSAGIVTTRFQFDAFAYDPETCEYVQNALRSALQSYSGTMGAKVVNGKITNTLDQDLTQAPTDASDTWLYRRVSEYVIRFQESTT